MVRRRALFVPVVGCLAVLILQLANTHAGRDASGRGPGIAAGPWRQACDRSRPAAGPRVYVSPRSGLVGLARNQPSGTTFCIEVGVHRLTAPIVPKNDDAFVGEPGAVLSGARSIAARFTPSGRFWVAAGQRGENEALDGECASGTACRYPNDVFLDDKPLTRVLDLSSLGPGRFYFDYGGHRIWIGDDPAGHLVEVAVATRAFQGWGSGASRVRIAGLVVEKFANEAQIGAINARASWVVEHNDVRLNHGVGVQDAGRIVDNRIHDNGQLGIGADGVIGGVVRGNEIDHNNYAGFDSGWEAGGGKWLKTSKLTVSRNDVRDNGGPGLWTDTDNIHTRYLGNTVVGNTGAGIFHEASYDAVIAHNVVTGNGRTVTGWVDGAGILVNSSGNVRIENNRLADNGDGIGLVQTDRGDGRYGPHVLHDVSVVGNAITMLSGHTGLVHDSGGDGSLYTSRGNHFDDNSYVLGCNPAPFAWAVAPGASDDAYIGKSAWIAAGNDRNGHFLSRCRGGRRG
jgi:parallel beta-helix repeat protein